MSARLRTAPSQAFEPGIREVAQAVHEERLCLARIREADAEAVEAADPRAETRARADGLAQRRRLVRLRIGALEGQTLAARLDRFVAERGDGIGAYLLDALAEYLADPGAST